MTCTYLTVFSLFLFSTYSLPQQTYNFNLSLQEEFSLIKLNYQKGDSVRWSATDYDDKDWEIIERKDLSEIPDSIYWLRAKINLLGNFNEYDFLQLTFLNLANAFEVYFHLENHRLRRW